MHDIIPDTTNDLLNFLTQKQSDLIETVTKELLSKAFENRYTLHPRRLREIAAEEVNAFLQYLSADDKEEVVRHGKERAVHGLGERPLLALLGILRQFSLALKEEDGFNAIQDIVKAMKGLKNYLF